MSRPSSWAVVVTLTLALALSAFWAFGTGAEVRQPVRSPSTSLSRPDMPASACASCHPQQAAEWRRSVMAHSMTSPLVQALEILIEEQVGRDAECPNGAGILRSHDGRGCRDATTGVTVTGSGGELWCVNCHAPGENLNPSLVAWDAHTPRSPSRQPLDSLLSEVALEGIGCAVCHQAHGPVSPAAQGTVNDRYAGNPFWISVRTGRRFLARPEEALGLFGISNSGYSLEPARFLGGLDVPAKQMVRGGAHRIAGDAERSYLRSSELCGACHDVRLFGSDAIGVQRGEHFKRLRNAYSEWRQWARAMAASGKRPASCQDCHMSSYPGVCELGEPAADRRKNRTLARACPPGTRFAPRPPGARVAGHVAADSTRVTALRPHYFTGVDVPLADAFDSRLVDSLTLDAAGIPLGARQRRDLLLATSARLELGAPSLTSSRLTLPVIVENVGAGHRIPAGFSQERELWVHLRILDAKGRLVYEVGRVDAHDEDLADKRFLRVTTDDAHRDGRGRPLGMFGADVSDGPDAPRWNPPPGNGTRFFGRGLINFQNGFLRCVRCIGRIDERGECQPLAGQDSTRAARFDDAEYDIDTGFCNSNLSGQRALFEIFFPVGALDAERGVLKAPDAIIDTRSLPPGVPISYTYELETSARAAPFHAEARLLFRAFPPYLMRAFIDYERRQAARGLRPTGPLIAERVFERIEVIEIARATRVIQ